MWAIIGGSGFEKFDEFKLIKELERETPYGDASLGLKLVELDGTRILFLPRHGSDHSLSPSEVNYRANIFALKKYGANKVLSVSAVGSLRKELAPGDLVIPSQYIDRTKSLRKATFCGDGVVGHVSMAEPTSKSLEKEVHQFIKEISFNVHFDKTYVCIEGPTFSTKAESHMYRGFGADIIGMTNVPECHLAREAGMSYLPFSFVTDYDCWKEDHPPVTLQEVVSIMKGNNAKAFALAKLLIPKTTNHITKEREMGLKTSIMSSLTSISKEKQSLLEILMS